MACTIARSRSVRSAAINASTSAGSKIRGRRRTAANQRHHATLAPMAALTRRQTARHRVRRHADVAARHQIAIQARHRSQPTLDRRRRQPRATVGDPHHVLRARVRALLDRDELEHIPRGHLGRLLADQREEHLQVMRIRPHRVRTRPSRRELQERVEQLMTDPIRPLTIGVHQALERRTPHHRTPSPQRTGTRGRLLGRSAQVADHPYKCRWRTLLRRGDEHVHRDTMTVTPFTRPAAAELGEEVAGEAVIKPPRTRPSSRRARPRA